MELQRGNWREGERLEEKTALPGAARSCRGSPRSEVALGTPRLMCRPLQLLLTAIASLSAPWVVPSPAIKGAHADFIAIHSAQTHSDSNTTSARRRATAVTGCCTDSLVISIKDYIVSQEQANYPCCNLTHDNIESLHCAEQGGHCNQITYQMRVIVPGPSPPPPSPPPPSLPPSTPPFSFLDQTTDQVDGRWSMVSNSLFGSNY